MEIIRALVEDEPPSSGLVSVGPGEGTGCAETDSCSGAVHTAALGLHTGVCIEDMDLYFQGSGLGSGLPVS